MYSYLYFTHTLTYSLTRAELLTSGENVNGQDEYGYTPM